MKLKLYGRLETKQLIEGISLPINLDQNIRVVRYLLKSSDKINYSELFNNKLRYH